jgi:hypothetical protein
VSRQGLGATAGRTVFITLFSQQWFAARKVRRL